jgi:hypothetical protein
MEFSSIFTLGGPISMMGLLLTLKKPFSLEGEVLYYRGLVFLEVESN